MRTSSDKASFQNLVHAARKEDADKRSTNQPLHMPQQEVKPTASKHLKKKQ